MLAEPDLDHRALAAALDEHHGLAPRTLRFVPAGETAWCYRLTDDRGGRCSPCWSACRPWEPMPAHGLGSGCCATATSSPTTSWWTGPAGLDPDLVAFFLLRRNLDDLADWLGAALEADRPDPQRRADLDGVRWCLSRRPELEARIDHTRRLLAQRRRIS